MTNETTRAGGCLCGAVRFTVSGEPYKSGLCHCSDCRHVTGSAFLAYADWRPDQFETTGQVATYGGRSFCPVCGSRLFSRDDHQVEIYLGALDDAPNGIAPANEGWTIRREHWQPAISGTGQFDRDPA
ncbi:MAG: GFA family protein [Alphaproteobacteria bacterium]|nr:MAG: GFA family protein [Alphaproteobacteria bacterium]